MADEAAEARGPSGRGGGGGFPCSTTNHDVLPLAVLL